MTRIRHDLCVLVQRSGRDLERRGDPLGPSARKLLVRNGHVERVLLGVDRDHISVTDESDGATNLRLGDDVADLDGRAKGRGEANGQRWDEQEESDRKGDVRRNRAIWKKKRRGRRTK